jgi:di/tricarboxylate transporter
MQGLSLAFLIGAIAIGFFRKINVGVVSIVLGFILTLITHGKMNVLFAGFPTKLFLTLLGTMFFFCLLQENKTLELLSKKIVSLFQTRPFLMPIVIYVVSYFMSAAGPGAISVQSVMVVFAVSLAVQMKASAILMASMAILGAVGGTASPIALTGIIVTDLTAKMNVPGIATPVFYGVSLVNFMIAVVFYIALGGYKIKLAADIGNETEEKLNGQQKICTFALLVLVILVVIFRLDVGMVSFSLAFILMLLKAVNDKKALKLVPWNVLLLICGVNVLMNVVKNVGGIKLLANILASMMNEHTASALIAATAGFMSWFSSANGVVFPTLIPTVPEIIKDVGGNVKLVEMIIGIVAAATVAGVSPLSTGGSLILATYAEATDASAEVQQKMFLHLFALSFLAVLIVVMFALVGGFKTFSM